MLSDATQWTNKHRGKNLTNKAMWETIESFINCKMILTLTQHYFYKLDFMKTIKQTNKKNNNLN